jgi:hypothetical protein
MSIQRGGLARDFGRVQVGFLAELLAAARWLDWLFGVLREGWVLWRAHNLDDPDHGMETLRGVNA